MDSLKINYEGEFENHLFENICIENVISHSFLTYQTSQ